MLEPHQQADPKGSPDRGGNGTDGNDQNAVQGLGFLARQNSRASCLPEPQFPLWQMGMVISSQKSIGRIDFNTVMPTHCKGLGHEFSSISVGVRWTV